MSAFVSIDALVSLRGGRRPTKQSVRTHNAYFVYMMTNISNTVIYTGVTNDLQRRLFEHRNGLGSSFAKTYRVSKLVYYEKYANPYDAISREKQLKAGPRKKKEALIRSWNPDWKDVCVD